MSGTLQTFASSLRRTLAMTRKEFRQLARDRITLGFIVGIPALQLVLFGYAINLDVRHVPTAVLDRAQSSLSRKLIGELEATQTFRLVRAIRTEAEAARLLENSEVVAVVLIPPDFDRHFYRGRGAEISILTDATNPTVASAVALAGRGFAQALTRRMQPFAGGGGIVAPRSVHGDRERFGAESELVRGEPFRVEVLPFYNPERRTPVFIVPGLVGVILTMTMMMLTALAIVREREAGTFEFLIATPIRRSEVMMGKILPYLVVGAIQVIIVIGLGALLFSVPIHGSLLDLAIASVPFLAAMLAMGLVVSAVSRSLMQATQMSFFFFLPSILLSGFMFPFETMPAPAQWMGQILPVTHYHRIVRGILLKGSALEALWSEMLAVSAFFLGALTLAIVTFRKRLG